jgi:hypothetical protein
VAELVLKRLLGQPSWQPRASEAPPSVARLDLILVDENRLLSGAVRAARPNVPAITDRAGMKEVRTLLSSRFGSVRLVRRAIESGFEYFVAKYYN